MRLPASAVGEFEYDAKLVGNVVEPAFLNSFVPLRVQVLRT